MEQKTRLTPQKRPRRIAEGLAFFALFILVVTFTTPACSIPDVLTTQPNWGVP